MPRAETIDLWVSAGASRDAIEGWMEDEHGTKRLRVRVSTPAEGGKANKRVLELVAAHLGVAKSCLTLVSGEKARYKRLEITR